MSEYTKEQRETIYGYEATREIERFEARVRALQAEVESLTYGLKFSVEERDRLRGLIGALPSWTEHQIDSYITGIRLTGRMINKDKLNSERFADALAALLRERQGMP